jgi:ubiquinone/menaquinone biosynthesis C-methylase UbiE
MNLNARVRTYWEKEPCGTNRDITDNTEEYSLEWFQRIEDYRYTVEPFILSAAQFARHKGKKILEIGVGAGTDHLQWAKAGLECYGVDITEVAVETTRKHLNLHGFQSNLQRVDAETLPFGDDSFDIVYSWGVIHHSEYPDKIVNEIYRVLRPSGEFIGMMYGRHSLVAFKL